MSSTNRNKRPSFKEFKEEALEKPEVKRKYEELIPVYEIRRKLIEMRLAKGLTQADIAKRMNTKKSNISRMECGEKAKLPTFDMINRYAAALDCKVSINFEPIGPEEAEAH
ncbi:MAG: helix-turn-helix domain-containing protein [Desulfarculaceae bacterium]|nr:helix-turn-helix domain-containing protein [Desulfarculaceae bacterium]